MYDAIIVGARCAGSSLALLLARRGHRVLVLDRDTFPSDMPMSTHMVHPRGVACLARWGLRDELAATGAPPVRRFAVDVAPFTLAGTSPEVEGQSAGFAPRRIRLDAILVRAATAAGAELRGGHRVARLLREGDRIVGVEGTTTDGRSFAERARIVVGADGPGSRVAAEAGAEELRAGPALAATAWVYWSGLPLDRVDIHLREHEAVYAFPCDDCTLIGVNWSMERFQSARKDIESGYQDILERLAPELARHTARGQRADPETHLASTRSFVRKAFGPGWVLVGDAHHKKDPCTAQGITDAFCSAERLAAILDQGFRGERDLGAALAEYEAERTAWLMPFFELTCDMSRFAAPTPEQVALYTALQRSQRDVDAFVGLITQATSPAEFFAPANVGRILGS
jgi:2-polyprenyl-6-methoxyphenol hydroxylase-like FAD-dependent oxidoreductase